MVLKTYLTDYKKLNMKKAILMLLFLGLFNLMSYGQPRKDYRPVTTKYSDGTTLTLGGYGDPSQYSFSNKNTGETGESANGNKGTNSKSKKKDSKEQRIEMIESGSMWTYTSCNECKNESKSKKAYKKFLDLIGEKKYGEALDLKQKEVNASFTEEQPDEMSLYRFYGLVIYCERQCILKYPNSGMTHIHKEGIKGAGDMVNAQLARDLAKPGKNINEYKIQVYSIAGMHDEAKKIYTAMGQADEKIDKAMLIATELSCSKPNEKLIIDNIAIIVDEKLKTIKGYTTEQGTQRTMDEGALGSFFTQILYAISQVSHSIRTESLVSLLKKTYENLNTSFTTEEGKERLLLAKAYFSEFGI
jgi:hypothetical protein